MGILLGILTPHLLFLIFLKFMGKIINKIT